MEKKYYLNLARDRPAIGILGEICWGFKVDNFEEAIGVKYEVAEALLERLIREKKAGNFDTYLSASEVEILKKGLIVVEKEIEEWEFHARMGATLEEVKNIPVLK